MPSEVQVFYGGSAILPRVLVSENGVYQDSSPGVLTKLSVRIYSLSVNSRTAFGRLGLQTQGLGAKSEYSRKLGDFGGTLTGHQTQRAGRLFLARRSLAKRMALRRQVPRDARGWHNRF